MTSSGQTLFNPSLGDLVVEAYGRCQIRPTSFTTDHMLQARQSAQFLLSEWATKPNTPNLWKISLFQTPLVQGISTYPVDPSVVSILDYYIRQFSMNPPVSVVPAFATIKNTPAVTVTLANHGLVGGDWMAVIVPVTVGGVILLGFYQLDTVIDVNTFTITAGNNATSTTSGGTVPLFTTTGGSTTVTVTLANHGYLTGEIFLVQVPATLGGITLSGAYSVTSTPTGSTFTIVVPHAAGSGASVLENGGLTQLETQNTNVDPDDRVIFPISRSEFSAIPDKFQQGFPTTVWWNRQINSTVNLWLVPDDDGPYVLNYYAMTQIQDAVLPGGVTMDLPYRALDAFAAGLAARLARKFAPALVGDLRLEAQMAWDAFSKQDSEDVPLFISPGLGSYYR